jgi:hypothetical protein
MINDLFHWLLATFVLAPVQAEIDGRLQAAHASRAVAEQVRTCIAGATPDLVRKASGDWVWGATTVIGVATGLSDPLKILADEAPGCRPAIDAARPFLRNDNRA